MKVFERIFDFYLDASIHVALGVFALLHITGYTLNVTINPHLGGFLFFGTIACYNFVKYGVEAEKYILMVDRYHKRIQFASFIALALALYNGYFLNLDVWIAVLCLSCCIGLYALPVLPHVKNLRSWGGLKIFVVALVWAGATVILPILEKKYSLYWDVWVETVQRFLFVLIVMLPFEIRDLAYDSPELKTLPQQVGIKRTKVFGALLTLPFFFLIFFKDVVSQVEAIAAGIMFLILGSLMFITKRNQKKYFASFWVESLPLVWWCLLAGITWYY
ncbi:UbiA prenyltransferase family protein [Pareuzebyella sediminis]|uniref:hypothetical protein n=1 Tax=Pareuzebyella sediminis TaxID=2607998 RepID=UPI0011ECF605|nr:hypothetical protein [Pareuzebyella sediminis]